MYPEEFAPNTVKVTMDIQVYRTPDNDPVATGLAPNTETTENGYDTGQSNFTMSKYITVEVRDKVTDKTVLYLPKAMITRRSGRGEAENLFVETWTIQSIGYMGPGQQSSLVGKAFKSIFGG